MILAQIPAVDNPWMGLAVIGFFALQAWQLWIAQKAREIGTDNKGAIGVVHNLVNSQRSALEDRLTATEEKLAVAVETIRRLATNRDFREGQDAGPHVMDANAGLSEKPA